jgi:hypothetical protein
VRRGVLLVLLAGCALASVRWLEAGWGHAKLLYWQGKCLRYSAPAANVIDQNGKGSVKEWEEFYALLSPPGRRAAPVMFLGEMRRRDGGRRLVAVEAVQSLKYGNPVTLLAAEYHVIEPGGVWSRPRLIRNEAWTNLAEMKWSSIQFYPGEIDPHDASHITIRYEVDGLPVKVTGVLDGWLQADDSLLLEVRRDASAPVPR